MFKVMFVSTIVGMLVAGAAVGVAMELRYLHALEMNARGYGPAYDPDGNFHWASGGIDQKIAEALKQTAMDGDSASVFDSLAASQPRAKKKR